MGARLLQQNFQRDGTRIIEITVKFKCKFRRALRSDVFSVRVLRRAFARFIKLITESINIEYVNLTCNKTEVNLPSPLDSSSQ